MDGIDNVFFLILNVKLIVGGMVFDIVLIGLCCLMFGSCVGVDGCEGLECDEIFVE